jgi:hypothetical protein
LSVFEKSSNIVPSSSITHEVVEIDFVMAHSIQIFLMMAIFPTAAAFTLLYCGHHETHENKPMLRITILRVVADASIEKEDEQLSERNDGNDHWMISSSGKFVPTSVRKRRQNRPILQVSNVQKFKDEVVDVADCMVCVRFYAPWCVQSYRK